MTRDELRKLVEEVQQRRSELDNIAVKAAHGDTPRRLYEPLSALANRTGGMLLEARAYYLLKKLCNIRRLRPKGKGKGRRYVLP